MSGYYADAILKFRVRFPFTYPARAPTVTFATDVFHPLISNEDGTLNLEPRFSPWRYVSSLQEVVYKLMLIDPPDQSKITSFTCFIG